jgi:NAD+ kinase
MRTGFGRWYSLGEGFDIRKVGIVANPSVDGGHLERLSAALENNGVEILEVRPDDEPDGSKNLDLVFVLGGDGTMLRAARMYPGRVLLGVNLGQVGFMSGMRPEDMESGVEKVLSGGLDVQEYRMLDVRIGAGETLRAINDAVLVKPRPHQIVAVEVQVGGEDLVSLQCDGFIASTPLGSTAYALSAGGPIVSGDVPCYVLVAIAPHSLVARPMVLGEAQVTGLRITDRGALLSIDGNEPLQIPEGERIEIGLSRETVRIGRTDEWTWWRAVRRTFL